MLCFCRLACSVSWAEASLVTFKCSSPCGKSRAEAEWLAVNFNFILWRGKSWLVCLGSVSPSWSNQWALKQRSRSSYLVAVVWKSRDQRKGLTGSWVCSSQLSPRKHLECLKPYLSQLGERYCHLVGQPGTLLNIKKCTGKSPQQRIICPKMSIVLRLRNSELG